MIGKKKFNPPSAMDVRIYEHFISKEGSEGLKILEDLLFATMFACGTDDAAMVPYNLARNEGAKEFIGRIRASISYVSEYKKQSSF